MLCNGQSLLIQSNPALYSLIGITYGGDGRTTFNLPNLCGRMMIGVGHSPQSSTNYSLGQVGGAETGIPPLQQHTHLAAFQGTTTTVPVSVPAPTVTATTALNIPIAAGAASPSAVATVTNGNAFALGGVKVTASGTPAAVAGPYVPGTPTGSAGSLVGTATTAVSVTGGGDATITVAPTGTVTVQPAGDTRPMSLMNPFLGLNFIICVNGLYPQRP